MRWRLVALVSLGVNLVLAAVWLHYPRHPLAGALAPDTGGEASAEPLVRTNVVVRRQFFSWQELESADYPTYILNLRAIGCPEQTIRDIIIADVNALFARKRATDPDIVTPDQQWWRSEPDTNVLHVALEKLRLLESERKALLGQLLGSNWESGDLVSLPRPSRTGVTLDGPVLGTLPNDVKQTIQDINARSEARLQAYLDAQRQQGKTPDPADLARLRQQTRDELAGVLSPFQLEEYLLRYSQSANNLRTDFGQLRFFNPTADEFRAAYRATENIDQQIQLLGDGTDPNTVQARQALETQRDNALKAALGQKRYDEYQLLHDPLYRAAVQTAQDAGTPEAARSIYQINVAALATQDAINANTNLTADQRAIEAKQLELDQLKANAIATGQALPIEPPPITPPRPQASYTMRPGDNLASISLRYGLSVAAIRAANPDVDFNRVRPGDSINIPRVPLPPFGLPPPGVP